MLCSSHQLPVFLNFNRVRQAANQIVNICLLWYHFIYFNATFYLYFKINIHSQLQSYSVKITKSSAFGIFSSAFALLLISLYFLQNGHSQSGFKDVLQLKPISHAPDRLNILWLRRIKFDLLPNFLDMHRHRGDISDRFHIPDLIKQLFFCIHMIWILS